MNLVRWCFALMFVVTLFTALSVWGGSMFNLFRSKPYPEAFFEGKQLKVAQTIKDKDAEAITRLAAELEDIDIPGHHSMTLLMFAVNDNNPVAIKALMALGADPSVNVADLGSVGHHAMWRKTTDALEALLEAGMDPNLYNGEDTLIFDTPELTENDALKLLIEYGADVNARDSLGQTALLHIIGTGFDEALYLLNHGADAFIMDNDYMSVAFRVQSQLLDMDQNSEAYQKMLAIKQKMIQQGVEFPVLSHWGERFLNGIVYCEDPKGFHPKEECKIEGKHPFMIEQPEHLKRQDEQILWERYGIKHTF